jgi:hypothetical protein
MEEQSTKLATHIFVSSEPSTRTLTRFHEAMCPGAALVHDSQLVSIRRGMVAAIQSMRDEARWAAEKAAQSEPKSFLERSDDEPAPSVEQRILLDTAEHLSGVLDTLGTEDALSNQSDLSISLPVGHWRRLLAILTALGQTVPDISVILPREEPA